MSVNLFEVIAAHPDKGSAYGQTFTDQGEALRYATKLQGLGYNIDPFPEFGVVETSEEALAHAAAYFNDSRITK